MACTVTTSTLFLHLSSHLISPGGATPDAREQKEKSSVLYYLARGLSDSVLPLSGSLINDLSPIMQMERKSCERDCSHRPPPTYEKNVKFDHGVNA